MEGQSYCPRCGALIGAGVMECSACGEKIAQLQPGVDFGQPAEPQVVYAQPQQVYAQPQVVYGQPEGMQGGYGQPQIVIQQVASPAANPSGISPLWPVKSKTTAGWLAILLGGLGAHKFYLGRPGMGLLYLFFSWTFIPAIAGIVEGIVYLCSKDENFQLKNRVRIGQW